MKPIASVVADSEIVSPTSVESMTLPATQRIVQSRIHSAASRRGSRIAPEIAVKMNRIDQLGRSASVSAMAIVARTASVGATSRDDSNDGRSRGIRL